MKKYQDLPILLLRLALAATFLSSVASRLSLWGNRSSGWENFVAYAAEVNSYTPASIIPVLAVMSTILETALAVMLLTGFKTRLAAAGSALLTLMFALAMAYSYGLKEPLDYSVFVDCSASFLLANMPQFRWSIDALLIKNQKTTT